MSLATVQRGTSSLSSAMFRLPVSGRIVALRPPTGAEDLLLLTAPGDETALTMALAAFLTRDVDGLPLEWGKMCVTDLDAFMLRLRQMWIGDHIRSDVKCPGPGCGQRIDISFTVSQFLAHHNPANSRSLVRGWTWSPADDSGWYGLNRKSGSVSIEFRLPTPNDQLAVAGYADAEAEAELARRCLRPSNIPARLRCRVEAIMETIAPNLSSDLQGLCPACGITVTVYFDARGYCLREFCNRAAFIYEDIDLLARRYHWPEQEILSLPHSRRAAYAELARRADQA